MTGAELVLSYNALTHFLVATFSSTFYANIVFRTEIGVQNVRWGWIHRLSLLCDFFCSF